MVGVPGTISYWLAEHPSMVGFRWNDSSLWGTSWLFLFASLFFHLLLCIFLESVLALVRRQRPLPLGPLPSLHCLAVALASAGIFAGTLASTAAEIRDTRWFWRRSKTPLQWLLCFPLGTRPTGRVFFWSYAFYLCQHLLLLRTLFSVLRRRRLTAARLLGQPILVLMSFLSLEYAQSFQVVAVLSATLAYAVVFGLRFYAAAARLRPGRRSRVRANCQLLVLACNLVGHVGVALLHASKGGCNGIGALVVNSVFNGVLLLLFLHMWRMKDSGSEGKKGL